MIQISMFEGFTRMTGLFSLEEILTSIRQGKYRREIEKIRAAVVRGEWKRVDRLKKQLPAVTFPACFEGGRKQVHLTIYNQLIVLDIDKVKVEGLERVVRQDEYTLACFRSPGGMGLKILIRIDSEAELHEFAFGKVADYYEGLLGVEVDRSGKDITRLCFLSWDEGLYYNPEARVFSIEVQEQSLESDQSGKRLEEILNFTQRKSQYHNGNRNNFLYQFAANCNRQGLPRVEVQDYCKSNMDLSSREIENTIKSAYIRHQEEFGIQKDQRKGKKEVPALDAILQEAPFFPVEIYAELPAFLRKHCAVFQGRREKDVFLSSALAVLSACTSNISGLYHGRITPTNLYQMILAPAASGKSVMRYARMLGEAYDQELSQSYTARQKAYQKALKAFEEGSCGAEPQKPRRELFYIPANSSSCRVIRHLQECSGSGIICETEADTLGNVLKQDWGGYSDILRKAYSGEPISLSRQSGDEFLSIAGVKLSVLMTGTPNQVFRLIPGAEDGLFSRFLFYAYSQPPRWEDVSPRGQALDLDDHFREGARELLNRIHYWKGKQISFQLTKVQWERINDRFSILLPRAVAISGKEAAATVKRYGNALFRIAMILTVCRTYEQGKTEKELECRDADFEIALNLVEVYLQHALFIVERLPKERTPSVNQLPYHKRQFFEALPKKFKRKEAVALGLSFEMKPRTVDRLLKDLVNVSLKEDGYGCYEKQ